MLKTTELLMAPRFQMKSWKLKRLPILQDLNQSYYTKAILKLLDCTSCPLSDGKLSGLAMFPIFQSDL